MGTKIYYNDKKLCFRCDKERPCRKEHCMQGMCEHTTDIEHAVFDGEKTFVLWGATLFEA